MGYIYQHDKRNGKTYVYEKVKKINPKTGMEVDARKIVGRLDPETNTIIPTGKKGPRPKKEPQHKNSGSAIPDYSSLYKEANIQLVKKNEEFHSLNEKYNHIVQKMKHLETVFEEGLRIIKS